jgi:type VI secretion system protein ImpF
VAELSSQERLQPSLLDRLTDDEPGNTQESRDKRILSVRKLRESVRRDLAWLLNASSLGEVQDLSDYPLVATSVLNYGVPDITGRAATGGEVSVLERRMKQAILDYEPRIQKNSLQIRILKRDEMSPNALQFEIECDIWSEPVPERLYLKTAVDLETGDVQVTDSVGH